MDWNKYGYVNASKYRRKLVICLAKDPKTPKTLADETGFHLSHVSTTLKELSVKKIAVCLSPELRVGRLYTLTGEGKEIAKNIIHSK